MTKTSERLELLRNQQKTTSTLFRPGFYRLAQQEDHEKFSKLLETPGITVVDHILEQISEFVKLKSPGRKFSTDELKSETEKHIGGLDLTKYGVWVHYPWSNRLVHILDEKEFIEVRTSRNQYKITREERDLLATKKIGVIGLSVGQSVSVTLVMERICGELRLADFDLLELTNLNRIRTGVHNLGLAKVYSVAREISEIDPFIKVSCFPEGLNENNLDEFFTKDGKLDLLVEESDGFDIKILSRYKARELGVPVIMEASDRCMVDVERFDLEPERNILHGIVKNLDIPTLKSLTTNEEKIPYMLDILGFGSTTARLRASMVEMQQTITTWPQLGSAVTMGGGITADVSRRILLNHFTDSGRYYVDIDELIGNKKQASENTKAAEPPATPALELPAMKAMALKAPAGEASEIQASDLQKIVEAAVAAPSYANKQPWKWLASGHRLFLFKDTQPSYLDADETNAYVSLGAAIENVVLKAAELGYNAAHTLFPAAAAEALVAVFSFRPQKNIPAPELSAYIFERHTNRKPGNKKPLDAALVERLMWFTQDQQGASLNFVTEREKIEQVAGIAAEAEQMRLLHPSTHAEYFGSELRLHAKQPVTEGIDIKTLELPQGVETAYEVMSDPKVAALLNTWEKGIAFNKLTYGLVASSSAIGLITAASGSREDLIASGRLAEKVWLAAHKNNLGFHPICVPLSFIKLLDTKNGDSALSDKFFSGSNDLKARFSLIFSARGSESPVFMFRLFEADKARVRSLRKPLNEVYFKS